MGIYKVFLFVSSLIGLVFVVSACEEFTPDFPKAPNTVGIELIWPKREVSYDSPHASVVDAKWISPLCKGDYGIGGQCGTPKLPDMEVTVKNDGNANILSYTIQSSVWDDEGFLVQSTEFSYEVYERDATGKIRDTFEPGEVNTFFSMIQARCADQLCLTYSFDPRFVSKAELKVTEVQILRAK